jgi:uncharacterized integral membrane protein
MAILLLLLGGVGLYAGSSHYPVRVLGIVAVMASVYMVRNSHLHGRTGAPKASNGRILEGNRRPTLWLWIISSALVPLLGIAFLLLHIDSRNGGHQAWPADVFAGVGLTCAIVWGCLVAKVLGGRRR